MVPARPNYSPLKTGEPIAMRGLAFPRGAASIRGGMSRGPAPVVWCARYVYI